MQQWQSIRTSAGLNRYQAEFRELSEAKKQFIWDEMADYLDEYAKNIRVIDHNASTSRDEPPLLRKRRGRARARGS